MNRELQNLIEKREQESKIYSGLLKSLKKTNKTSINLPDFPYKIINFYTKISKETIFLEDYLIMKNYINYELKSILFFYTESIKIKFYYLILNLYY